MHPAETLRLTLAIADWQPLRFEAVHGVILVEATLNGRPATLLVDNGSDRTLVDPAAAARAGLRLSAGPGGLQTGNARMATQLAEGLALDMPHVLAIPGSPTQSMGDAGSAALPSVGIRPAPASVRSRSSYRPARCAAGG